MTASTIFVLLLVLACPLMMILMMRGHGHGHAGSDHGNGRKHEHHGHNEASTEELRRLRDELERVIAEREQFDGDGSSERYERAPTATRSG